MESKLFLFLLRCCLIVNLISIVNGKYTEENQSTKKILFSYCEHLCTLNTTRLNITIEALSDVWSARNMMHSFLMLFSGVILTIFSIGLFNYYVKMREKVVMRKKLRSGENPYAYPPPLEGPGLMPRPGNIRNSTKHVSFVENPKLY